MRKRCARSGGRGAKWLGWRARATRRSTKRRQQERTKRRQRLARRALFETLERREVMAAEINTQVYTDPALTITADVADNTGSVAYGTTTQGTSVTKTYRIQNLGDAPLMLGPVSAPGGFTVTTQPMTMVMAGMTSTFAVRLDATTTGSYSGSLSFTTNDTDENPYNFTLSGTVDSAGPQPEVGFAVYTDPGLTTTSDVLDNTGSVSFGTTTTGTPLTKTFRIQNTGAASLTLGTPSLPTGFTLQGSFPGSVAAGASSNFTVQLTAAASGSYSGSFSVSTNDADENPYNFTLSGTVNNPAAQPEIAVAVYTDAMFMLTTDVPDNSGSVSYGSTPVGTAITKTFRIQNTGSAALTLDTGSLTLPSGFTLITPYASSVAAGGMTTFAVRLDATTAGSYSGSLSFTNNDGDENPYNFALSGTVTAPAPEIAVGRYIDAQLTMVSDVPDNTGSYNYGTTTAGAPLTQTYRIQNTGPGTLNLSGLTLPSGFALVGSFPTTVASQAATNFVVQLAAAAAGSYSGQISFTTNDADENPFNFTLSGTVLAPPELAVALVNAGGGTTDLTDNVSTVDFGTSLTGSAATRTLRISNTGDTTLTLSPGSVQLPMGYAVVGSFPSSVAAGQATDVVVQLNATAGTYNGTFSFTSNDSDESPFELSFTGVRQDPPEIVVGLLGADLMSLTNIADGTSTVELGAALTGVNFDRTFRIQNTGDGPLTLDPNSLQLPSGFTLLGSFPATVGANNYGDFTLRLNAATAGTYSGTVSFTNSDADEGAFDFGISVTATDPTPEIAVSAWDEPHLLLSALTHNQSAVWFGQPVAGQTVERELYLQNLGTATLTLDANSWVVPDGFTLVGTLPTSIAVGAGANLTVRMHATQAGEYGGVLEIPNNDIDEGPFRIALAGEFLPAVPEIVLGLQDVMYQISPQLPSGASSVDFGTLLPGQQVERTFRFRNDGTGPLTLDANSLQLPTGWSLVGSLPETVAVFASASFTLRFTAGDPGAYGGTFSVATNDPDESPYTFDLAAAVEAPAPELFVGLWDAQLMVRELTSGAGGVTFSDTHAGQPLVKQLQLRNAGTATLTFDVNAWSLPDGFTLTSTPPASLAPGAATILNVRLDATTAGVFSGDLTLVSDDADEANFVVPLYGAVEAVGPEIAVALVPTSGQTAEELANHLGLADLGSTRAGTPLVRSLRISNHGNQALLLDRQSLVLPAGFTLVTPFAEMLPAGESTLLSIQVDAQAPGFYDGVLTFTCNDADEAEYEVNVQAEVLPLPALAELGLVTDDGAEDDDGITTDPTLHGTLSSDGIGPHWTIEFDHDGDSEPEGETTSGGDGSFSYYPAGLPYGAAAVRGRVRVWDGVHLAYVYGPWQEVQFTYAQPVNALPEVAELKLVRDTGASASDHETSDPRVSGQVTHADGPVALLTVEFDLDNDGEVDGTATTDGTGRFEFEPTELPLGEVTLRARAVERDPQTGDPLPGPWQQFVFTLTAAEFAPPSVQTLALRYDTGASASDGITADPRVQGQLAGESLAYVTVEFDHDGDGQVDGTTESDAQGGFRYRPSGLSVGTVTLRARSRAYDPQAGEFVAGDWTTLAFTYAPTVNVAPTVSSLSLASDSGPSATDGLTANPTFVGVLSNDGPTAGLLVELDLNNDDTPDVQLYADSQGEFLYTPQGLVYGSVTVQARAREWDAAAGAFVTGAWQALSFTYEQQTDAAPVFAALGLAHDTGAANDGITSDPTLSGRVLNEGSLAGLTIEFDHDNDGQLEGAVRTDSRGRFSYLPLGLAAGSITLRARTRETSADGQSILVGAWTSFTFTYEEVVNAPPAITEFGLVRDTGASDSDGQTSDPRVSGLVTNAEGPSGLLVQLDFDGDDQADGWAQTDASGGFVFTPLGLALGAHTLRARAVEYVGATPSYSAWASVELTLVPREPSRPEVTTLALTTDDGPSSSDRVTTVGEVAGQLAGPGIAGLTVEYDLNADGVVDGTVISDANGAFVLPAVVLPAEQAYGVVTVAARPVDAQSTTSPLDWKRWQFVLSSDPAATAALALAAGIVAQEAAVEAARQQREAEQAAAAAAEQQAGADAEAGYQSALAAAEAARQAAVQASALAYQQALAAAQQSANQAAAATAVQLAADLASSNVNPASFEVQSLGWDAAPPVLQHDPEEEESQVAPPSYAGTPYDFASDPAYRAALREAQSAFNLAVGEARTAQAAAVQAAQAIYQTALADAETARAAARAAADAAAAAPPEAGNPWDAAGAETAYQAALAAATSDYSATVNGLQVDFQATTAALNQATTQVIGDAAEARDAEIADALADAGLASYARGQLHAAREQTYRETRDAINSERGYRQYCYRVALLTNPSAAPPDYSDLDAAATANEAAWQAELVSYAEDIEAIWLNYRIRKLNAIVTYLGIEREQKILLQTGVATAQRTFDRGRSDANLLRGELEVEALVQREHVQAESRRWQDRDQATRLAARDTAYAAAEAQYATSLAAAETALAIARAQSQRDYDVATQTAGLDQWLAQFQARQARLGALAQAQPTAWNVYQRDWAQAQLDYAVASRAARVPLLAAQADAALTYALGQAAAGAQFATARAAAQADRVGDRAEAVRVYRFDLADKDFDRSESNSQSWQGYRGGVATLDHVYDGLLYDADHDYTRDAATLSANFMYEMGVLATRYDLGFLTKEQKLALEAPLVTTYRDAMAGEVKVRELAYIDDREQRGLGRTQAEAGYQKNYQQAEATRSNALRGLQATLDVGLAQADTGFVRETEIADAQARLGRVQVNVQRSAAWQTVAGQYSAAETAAQGALALGQRAARDAFQIGLATDYANQTAARAQTSGTPGDRYQAALAAAQRDYLSATTSANYAYLQQTTGAATVRAAAYVQADATATTNIANQTLLVAQDERDLRVAHADQTQAAQLGWTSTVAGAVSTYEVKVVSENRIFADALADDDQLLQDARNTAAWNFRRSEADLNYQLATQQITLSSYGSLLEGDRAYRRSQEAGAELGRAQDAAGERDTRDSHLAEERRLLVKDAAAAQAGRTAAEAGNDNALKSGVINAEKQLTAFSYNALTQRDQDWSDADAAAAKQINGAQRDAAKAQGEALRERTLDLRTAALDQAVNDAQEARDKLPATPTESAVIYEAAVAQARLTFAQALRTAELAYLGAVQPLEKARDDGLADDWWQRNDDVIDANLKEDQALDAALNSWLSANEEALLAYDVQYGNADTTFTQLVATANDLHDDKLAAANKKFDLAATAAGVKYFNAVAALRAGLGQFYTQAQWAAFEAAELGHRQTLADELKQARLDRANEIGAAKVDRAADIGAASAIRAADYGDATRTLAGSLNTADVGLQQADAAAGNTWASEVAAAETTYTSNSQQRHVTYVQAVYSAPQGQTSLYVTLVENRTTAEVELAEDLAQASTALQIAQAEDLVNVVTAAAALAPSDITQQALASANRIHDFLVASQNDYVAYVRATAQAGANAAIADATATAARRVTQATDQKNYANAVATAKATWLTETVAAQEAADVRLEQDYAVRRAAFAEETAARLLAQAGAYSVYDQAVQTAEQNYQTAFINQVSTASDDRLDQLDAAVLALVTGLADIDLAWMSGGLAQAPTGGPAGQTRTGPSGGPLPGAAAIIHAYADATAADEWQEAYELSAAQKKYEKAEHLAAKNRELADHASLKTYEDALADAAKQRYVDEATALANWQEVSASITSTVTAAAFASLGTPYAQFAIDLTTAEAALAAAEKPYLIAYYTQLGDEQKQALQAIAAERQTRSDAISVDRLTYRDAVSEADEQFTDQLADHAWAYTTGIAPAREDYRDALGVLRHDNRIAVMQYAVANGLTVWHGGQGGTAASSPPPSPGAAASPPAPAVAQVKSQAMIDYGIAEARELGDWAVADATALETQVTTSETAWVTYVTQRAGQQQSLGYFIADEQLQLTIDVANLTAAYLAAAATRIATGMQNFATAHPSPWATEAASNAAAAAAKIAADALAGKNRAIANAQAQQGAAYERVFAEYDRAVTSAAQAKNAAINHAHEGVLQATAHSLADQALALLGLYEIVDLPWEPRPGSDLPTGPLDLDEDKADYAPRTVDTWFASLGTPEALMVLSLAGSGGLPYAVVGSAAMFAHLDDDGGDGGLGPNGTNRSPAHTSAGRRSGDLLSQGLSSDTEESFAQQTGSSSTATHLASATGHEVTAATGQVSSSATAMPTSGPGDLVPNPTDQSWRVIQPGSELADRVHVELQTPEVVAVPEDFSYTDFRAALWAIDEEVAFFWENAGLIGGRLAFVNESIFGPNSRVNYFFNAGHHEPVFTFDHGLNSLSCAQEVIDAARSGNLGLGQELKSFYANYAFNNGTAPEFLQYWRKDAFREAATLSLEQFSSVIDTLGDLIVVVDAGLIVFEWSQGDFSWDQLLILVNFIDADAINAASAMLGIRIGGQTVKLTAAELKYLQTLDEAVRLKLADDLAEGAVRSSDDVYRVLLPILQKSCFAAGTPILTPCGSRPIEHLQPGDSVLSRPEGDPTGPVHARIVERVFVRTSEILHVFVGGQQIRTTAEHPFYVNGRGWVRAGDLEAGDMLLGVGGQCIAVGGVERTTQLTTVYNLTIAEDHTYFVGSPEWGFSVWVHNTYTAQLGKNGLWEIVDDAGDVVQPGFKTQKEAAEEAARLTKRQAELAAAVNRTTPGGRKITSHAFEDSLVRHGFEPPFGEIDDIIASAQWTARQSDGAIVHIYKVAGRVRRYHIVIEGSEGIVTAMKNRTAQELRNLANNYGFTLPW